MTLAPTSPEQDARPVRDETTSGETGLGAAKTTFIALTSVTAASGLLCHPAVGSADFATSSPVFLISEVPVRGADVWARLRPASAITNEVPVAVVRSDQAEILWVKEQSGLTWDQLGRVFGVSRRAVHLWANGGRLNEANAEVLRRFAAEVATHKRSSPAETRAALLARAPGAGSVLDNFRRAQVRTPGEAIGAPFTAEEKVENIREVEADEA